MHRRPTKRALLIGVADYENDSGFSPLKAPLNDVHLLREVLEDPELGAFHSVSVLMNPSQRELSVEIANFLEAAELDDTVLLYFSGHGKFPQRADQAYLAARDTWQKLMNGTGVSASFVRHQLEQCLARARVVILDCCSSGKFARGMLSKSGTVEHDVSREHFGEGTWVLSAGTGVEEAYEYRDSETGLHVSHFTKGIIEGIRTGQADRDQDGRVSVKDLYDFARAWTRKEVKKTKKKKQMPTLTQVETVGDVIISNFPRPARSPNPHSFTPAKKKNSVARRAILACSAIVATSGSVFFLADFPSGGQPGGDEGNGSPSASPRNEKSWVQNTGTSVGACATRGNEVYCIDPSSDKVYAFGAKTGKELWGYDLHRRAAIYAVPLIVNGTVYIPVYDSDTGGGLLAINAKSGSKRWFRELGKYDVSATATFSDDKVFVSDAADAYALNPATGEVAWKRPIGGGNNASPVGDNGGSVYVGGGYGDIYRLDVEDGSVVWKKKVDGGTPGQAVIANGEIYIGTETPQGSGKLYAFEPFEGEINWSYATGAIISPPVVMGDLVYLQTETGRLEAVNRETHRPKWVRQVGGGGIGPLLAFSEDSLYVGGDDGFLRSIDFQSGTEKWSHAGNESVGIPTLWRDQVIFGSEGTLYSVDAKTGK
ncbi:PQQ-binding-like beta-propeller repeat protein [Streptomyces sp. NBC_01594]|uniref:caspase, EACC1-associated type n=1 Tax=Streptomyces sp. NBC_01594 TaxID=2975890 RepID=UPI00386F9C00